MTSLPASLMADALIRQVMAAGGFATVLAKGSPWGAAMLVVHRRPGNLEVYERVPDARGDPVWRVAAEGEEPVSSFIERQRRFDSELWVVELDIVDWQRFIPGKSAFD